MKEFCILVHIFFFLFLLSVVVYCLGSWQKGSPNFKFQLLYYSCFQKCSRNVLFFLLFDAFRRLNVAERKWVNPTHFVYLFLRSYSLYAFTTCPQQELTLYPLYKSLWKGGTRADQRAKCEENFSRVWAVPRCGHLSETIEYRGNVPNLYSQSI